MFKIKFLTADSRDFCIVKSIRTTVFTNEQGADGTEEFDSFDNIGAPAVFALLFEDDVPAATARLVICDKRYKIGRIAVLKEFRGKGYGDVIVRTMLLKAFDSNAEEVFVDAQNYAVPFYEKIGFEVIGAQITDRGLPHIPMKITEMQISTGCGCSQENTNGRKEKE